MKRLWMVVLFLAVLTLSGCTSTILFDLPSPTTTVVVRTSSRIVYYVYVEDNYHRQFRRDPEVILSTSQYAPRGFVPLRNAQVTLVARNWEKSSSSSAAGRLVFNNVQNNYTHAVVRHSSLATRVSYWF